ncbi:hypothetical protein [Apilactobacillus ozensis]|uniref:hypothetical protein n=1 Tax=Apilactobacillus ozensis TaxID=866801 RepID=UPI00200A703C|nr:hypothetical protein [Apilactobacillus ozensis]MCK8607210.1 hypothetical protein [Apilactobacillus ozensis]
MLFKIIFGSLSGTVRLAVAIIEGLFYIGCLIVLFQILRDADIWPYIAKFLIYTIVFGFSYWLIKSFIKRL